MPATSPGAIARKNARKRKLRAEKRAAVLASLKRPESKTSPEYRRRLPPAPLLTKQQMHDQLRQAVLNTGGWLA